MMFLFGLFALGAAIVLLKWYVDADSKKLKGSLRWTGVLLGAVLIIFLVGTGRLGPAMAMLTAFAAWVWRVFGMWQSMRQVGGMFGRRDQDQQAGGGSGPHGQPAPAPGAMDEAEALRILGLSPGANRDDIKAAHRRLMAQLHPDKGGSDYLAAKINAAKDVLLKRAA